jgi:hypothetical protein
MQSSAPLRVLRFALLPATILLTVLTASEQDLAAGRVPPAGFSTDVRATYADGRGKDSARWPVPHPLFAQDLSNADFTPGAWAVDAEGVLAPARETNASHRGDIWTKASYGDFVLNVEFRTRAAGANSGVFLRCSDTANWLHHSIEVQIFQGDTEPVHAVGAIFDVAAPRRVLPLVPGEWNRYTIIARKNLITVILNGEEVNKIDLDEWTQAGLNPDGTKNKFATACKDMARNGRIGLQDHGGSRVEFRHLFIERL